MENSAELNKTIFETALLAAKAGATVLKNHYLNLNKLSFEDKGNNDIVSIADKESDAAIRKIILAKFPTHSFFSEEDKESDRISSDYLWIVDPLDGTNNFALGMNNFVTMLCLIHKGIPLFSLIYNPLTDQYVWADSQQAYFMDQPLKLNSKAANLNKLFISMIGGYAVVNRIRSFVKFCLEGQSDGDFRRILQSWAPGVDFFSAAEDKLQGFYLLQSQAYDLLPGMHILKKLGFLISLPNGEQIDFTKPEIILPDIIIAHDQQTLAFMTQVYQKWQTQPTP